MTEFIEDTRAIPPAVSLIALVALVIVLIAAFGGVLLSNSTNAVETPPEMRVQFDNTPGGDLTVTHLEGDSVNPEKLEITFVSIDSTQETTMTLDNAGNYSAVSTDIQGDRFAPGDSFDVTTDDIQIIWIAQESDETVFVGSYP